MLIVQDRVVVSGARVCVFGTQPKNSFRQSRPPRGEKKKNEKHDIILDLVRKVVCFPIIFGHGRCFVKTKKTPRI